MLNKLRPPEGPHKYIYCALGFVILILFALLVRSPTRSDVADAMEKGKESGYTSGCRVGHQEGYDEGHSVGYEEGRKAGYKEGRSVGYEEGYKDGKAAAAASSVATSPAAASVSGASAGSEEVTATYIANKNTKVFHKPECTSVTKMAEHNKWEYTGKRSDLISKGYRPCSICDP